MCHAPVTRNRQEPSPARGSDRVRHRSPIGRAAKGSLKDVRPNDLTTTIVRAALDKVPGLDPTDIDDLDLGCGLPGGEGDVFVSTGVETVSRFVKGTSDSHPNTMDPAFADAGARTRELAEGGADWTEPRAQELDELGVRSQNLAEQAIVDGFWAREITPVTTPDGTVISVDDGRDRA
jgi:acetyl-CoA C-acetyltransferase